MTQDTPRRGIVRRGVSARPAGAARAVAAAVALLASALGVSSPAAAQTQPFTDTSQDAYYSEAVNALADGGIFDGTECAPGMLCPGEPIDRKTMAVWTVRALDGEDPAPIPNSRFADVAADSFHGPFIERMAELDVTTGCGDRTAFCPDNTVTRNQMAVFLTRAFNLDPGPDPGFSDLAPDAWYYDHVAALAASGITTGCGDGTTFCPHRQTTRAQMAAFLARATGLVDDDCCRCGSGPNTHRRRVSQFGGNTITCRGRPTRPITAGTAHFALRTDNTITCWGNNDSGQADAPDGQYTAITASSIHSCALRTDNTITCWGAKGLERANAPDGQYTAITAGYGHSCALRTDNTITCWGNKGFGQADAPDGQYTAITADSHHSCALRTDNTITCWGANRYGQADAPDGQYTAITAGTDHSCASARSSRRFWCSYQVHHHHESAAPRPIHRHHRRLRPLLRPANRQHHHMLGQQILLDFRRARRPIHRRHRRPQPLLRSGNRQHHHMLGHQRLGEGRRARRPIHRHHRGGEHSKPTTPSHAGHQRLWADRRARRPITAIQSTLAAANRQHHHMLGPQRLVHRHHRRLTVAGNRRHRRVGRCCLMGCVGRPAAVRGSRRC